MIHRVAERQYESDLSAVPVQRSAVPFDGQLPVMTVSAG